MVIATENGYLNLYDLSRREAKLIHTQRSITELLTFANKSKFNEQNMFSRFQYKWASVAINCSGNIVSFTLESKDIPDLNENNEKVPEWKSGSELYVWYINSGEVHFYDFKTGFSDTAMGNSWANYRTIKITKSSLMGWNIQLITNAINCASACHDRIPVKHFWDLHDPHLVTVQCCENVECSPVPATRMSIEAMRPMTRSSTGLYRPLTRGGRIGELTEFTNRLDSLQPNDQGIIDDILVSILATNEPIGLVSNEFLRIPIVGGKLIGVDVPYLFIAHQFYNEQRVLDTSNDSEIVVHRHLMRDFQGLDSLDANIRKLMLDFSYNLTLGNMDIVFKAMKFIKNEAVWKNLLKMCVIGRRIDVAKVCLGKMQDAWGAQILRQAKTQYQEPEAQLASLAIYLGMLREAELLFSECERYDLLRQMYQNSCEWDKAIKMAEINDRIRLRSTHYQYAQYLEQKGEIELAIEQYKLSDTHLVEVPRIFQNQPKKIWEFVNQNNNPKLFKWAGKYFECLSAGILKTDVEISEEFVKKAFDLALEYYQKAGDALSQVRLLSAAGRPELWQQALDICDETQDRSALYYMGKQLEARNQIDEAIKKFSKARAHSTAAKLAKEHHKIEHLYGLVLLGHKSDMLDAAEILQDEVGFEGQASMLYHKAGQTSKALELAFEKNQFSAIQQIAGSFVRDEIRPSKDDQGMSMYTTPQPHLITKCVEFFVQNAQFDKAIELLTHCERYTEALKLCLDYRVNLSEDLCEILTPPSDWMSPTSLHKYLTDLGDHCMIQGEYQFACKKYIEAGDRVSAMKALLRSGETERIIFFAQVSKQREIYVMAANYLQRLDKWRSDPEILRQIVQFYTRGKVPESLAMFYESCAQADIDDFQNYEKATNALSEAYKVIGKMIAMAKEQNQSPDDRILYKLQDLKTKIVNCKKFDQLLKMLDSPKAEEAFKIYKALASECQIIEDEIALAPIRLGHIYATLVNESVSKMKHEQALLLIDEFLRKLGSNPNRILNFIDQSLIISTYTTMGKSVPKLALQEEPQKENYDLAPMVEEDL